MKKLALTLLLAFASIAGFSQSGLYFGGKYVFQNTWLFNEDVSDDGDQSYVASFGSAFGIELGYNLTSNFGIGTEINYSIISQKIEISDPFFSLEAKTTINYLQLPVLISFSSDQENSAFFLSSVGPVFHIPLSAEMEALGFSQEIEKGDLGSPIGIMLNLGAGFNIMDGLAVTTGLRLGYGFTDVFENDVMGTKPTNLAFGGLMLGGRYTLQ